MNDHTAFKKLKNYHNLTIYDNTNKFNNIVLCK